MFMALCAVLILAMTPLLGGDLRKLGKIRLRYTWVVFAALVVQVIVISLLPVQHLHGVESAAHVLSYVAVVAVLAVNWRIPGVPIVALGAVANGVAIAVNGGTLPASAVATAAAHIHKHGSGLDNSAPLAHPHLSWLGDRFVTPHWMPFQNVASIGDLLILLGAAVMVWVVTGVFGRMAQRGKPPAQPETITNSGVA